MKKPEEKTTAKETVEKYVDDGQQAIIDIVAYCRAKEAQVKDFGHQMLDSIAKDTEMPDNLKTQIKYFIDHPEEEFKIKANLK